MDEIKLSQEQVDAILEYVEGTLQDFTHELNSLVSEDDFVNKQYQKIQDYVIRQRLYKGQPDHLSHADILINKLNSKEIHNSLVSEGEGFTKLCVCGSTMHLQHHWECLNCKKGIKETDTEIAKREIWRYVHRGEHTSVRDEVKIYEILNYLDLQED